MRWSFRIARVFGIDLKVHFSFFLILLLGAVQWSRYGATGMGFGVLLMVLLFVCVTLHELGHSLVAQRFGIEVREIVLLPIGGVAMLGRIPRNPTQELLIALAGPAVNVVIVAGLAVAMRVLPGVDQMDPTMALRGRGGPSLDVALSSLYWWNIAMVLFNMIPAFPLDGGRVLRAVLAYFMPHAKATRIAGGVGQVGAVVLGVYGVMTGQILLAVIAFFIFLTAGAESAESASQAVLATRRVGDAYNRHAITLSIDDRVSRVVDYILTSYQPDFAVIHRGQLQGVVTREDVMKWLSENSYDVFVTEVMKEAGQVTRVDADTPLDEVRQKLGEAGARVAAVFEGGTFLGLVSAEDITEAFAVLTFLQRAVTHGGRGGLHSVAAAGGAPVQHPEAKPGEPVV